MCERELDERPSEHEHDSIDRIVPLIYSELRTIASAYLRKERVDHTLRATALVHEAYLKLEGKLGLGSRSEAHFVGIAAKAMRQILVDHDRGRRRIKRGGDAKKISLEVVEPVAPAAQVDLLALDELLAELETIDVQQSRIVELRFFGGLSVEETASVLGVSAPTVKRNWAMAKAWLFRKLSDAPSDSAADYGETESTR